MENAESQIIKWRQIKKINIMAANNPIIINCKKCGCFFPFDVIRNLNQFNEEDSCTREQGEERTIQTIIECPKCKSSHSLRVILYPCDDIEYFEVEEVEVSDTKKSKEQETISKTKPLF